MKRFKIEISQNRWEYTGYSWITCNTLEKIGDDSLLVDGKYELKFDEEIGNIKESGRDDKDYYFEGIVSK